MAAAEATALPQPTLGSPANGFFVQSVAFPGTNPTIYFGDEIGWKNDRGYAVLRIGPVAPGDGRRPWAR